MWCDGLQSNWLTVTMTNIKTEVHLMKICWWWPPTIPREVSKFLECRHQQIRIIAGNFPVWYLVSDSREARSRSGLSLWNKYCKRLGIISLNLFTMKSDDKVKLELGFISDPRVGVTIIQQVLNINSTPTNTSEVPQCQCGVLNGKF